MAYSEKILREAAEKLLPPNIRNDLLCYVLYGHMSGHFVEAVICNDLMKSFQYGDLTSLKWLSKIVTFMYQYVPLDAWRSENNMIAWREQGGSIGKPEKEHSGKVI